MRIWAGLILSVALAACGKSPEPAAKPVEAPAPKPAESPQALVLQGHSEGLLSAVFSHDGTRIITTSADNTAKVWRAQDGGLIATLAHPDWVRSAAFSPDGTLIATGGQDGAVRLWSATDFRLITTLSAHETVGAVAFSPSGAQLATGGWEGFAKIWTVGDGALVRTIDVTGEHDKDETAREGGIFDIGFSPDGAQIITADGGNLTASVFGVADGKAVQKLPSRLGNVVGARFSPKGDSILTAALGGASIWRVKDGSWAIACTASGASIRSAAFSADGAKFVSTDGNSAGVWDSANCQSMASFTDADNNVLTSADLSPDGARLVIVSGAHAATVWLLTPQN
jgi:WD40 repeat protein